MDDFDDFSDFANAVEGDTRDDFLSDLGDVPEVDTHDVPEIRWSQWESELQDYADAGQISQEAIGELEVWYFDPDFGDYDDFVADVEGDDADHYE